MIFRLRGSVGNLVKGRNSIKGNLENSVRQRMDGLFPLPAGTQVTVRQIQRDDGQGRVTVEIASIEKGGCCPLCGQLLKAVHSKYRPHLNDLSGGGWQVVLRLEVHKYFCKNLGCPRRIFTERLPEVARPYGHQPRTANLALVYGTENIVQEI
jgi:hypothetical protein